jgi:hypothetical protein
MNIDEYDEIDGEEELPFQEDNIDEIIDESEEIITDPEVIREDKIFNNKYNTGDGLDDSLEYSYSKKISVSSEYSENYLKDIYEYEDALESKFILDSIFNFIEHDQELSDILKKSSPTPYITKSKFSKDDVNIIFNKINENLEIQSSSTIFYSPIYILEVISSVSSIEYKKLFDMLDTDIQEMLLTELNKKYKFLDVKLNKKRIH